MNNLTKISFLTLVVGIFASCQLPPSAIFQNETCSPPCWNGIIPGETSPQEINAKLELIPMVDSKSIKTMFTLQSNDSVDFKFLPSVKETGGRIYSQDGVVQAISFWSKPNTLRLSESLQKWGPPDQYISIYYSKAEIPYLVTNIIYTKKGLILYNGRDMRAEEVPSFDNNFPIQIIRYVNPNLITTLLTNGSLDALNDQDILDGLKSWTGLGEIQYLKRSFWGVK